MRRTDAQSAAVPIKMSYFNGRVVLLYHFSWAPVSTGPTRENWLAPSVTVRSVSVPAPPGAALSARFPLQPARADTASARIRAMEKEFRKAFFPGSSS